MTLSTWEPVRLFSTFFDTPTTATPQRVARRWVPPMDLAETTDHYLLRADLPGLAQDDVTIEVEDRVLTVSGERKVEPASEDLRYVRVERAAGAFRRTVTLPEGTDAEGITATFEHGVLTVQIPKPQAAKPRRVEITVGDGPKTIEG